MESVGCTSTDALVDYQARGRREAEGDGEARGEHHSRSHRGPAKGRMGPVACRPGRYVGEEHQQQWVPGRHGDDDISASPRPHQAPATPWLGPVIRPAGAVRAVMMASWGRGGP